jgi:sulfur carrier protein ThiS
MQMVKVAKLGSRVNEVALDDNATINDALRASGTEAGGFELRLNGTPVDGTSRVHSGDIVTLVPQIKGGC